LSTRRTLYSLALIAIVVLLVRGVVFQVYSPDDKGGDAPDRWLTIARNVVSGQGYALSTYGLADSPRPTALRGPTVVYFFAAVLWLFGDHLWVIVAAQWMVDVGTSIVLFFIALEIFRDRRVAFVASLLFALYAPGFIFSFRAMSEPVSVLVLASFTLSFLRALRQPSTWRFALCGALLGLVVLARPVMQFYSLLALPLLGWMLSWRWRQALSSFVVLFAAFAAVMMPWVVRNYLVFDAFIPGSTQKGKPLYQSHFALGQPDYLSRQGTDKSGTALRQVLESHFGPAPDSPTIWTYAKAKGINEVELDHIALQEAKEIIRAFPGRYVVLSLVRVLRFWFHHRVIQFVMSGGRMKTPKVVLTAVVNATLLGLALAGLVRFRGTWLRPAMPLIVLIVYHTVIYAATHAIGRYSVPIMPYVMVLAAYTLVNLLPGTNE